MINLLEKAIDAMSFIFQIHQKDGLVGGFNPFEIGNLPQIGLTIKIFETTTQGYITHQFKDGFSNYSIRVELLHTHTQTKKGFAAITNNSNRVKK